MAGFRFARSAGLGAVMLALSAICALARPGYVGATVNLRQGAGTNTPIVGKIPAGAAIDIAGCKGEWCQVSFAGKHGYVIATAVRRGARVAAGPPPGYVPPPVVYDAPPPPPPPPPVYFGPPVYYGGYYGYGPEWGWGSGCCWHRGWGRRW